MYKTYTTENNEIEEKVPEDEAPSSDDDFKFPISNHIGTKQEKARERDETMNHTEASQSSKVETTVSTKTNAKRRKKHYQLEDKTLLQKLQ